MSSKPRSKAKKSSKAAVSETPAPEVAAQPAVEPKAPAAEEKREPPQKPVDEAARRAAQRQAKKAFKAASRPMTTANPLLAHTTQQWAERAVTALQAIAAKEDKEKSLLFPEERLVRLQVEHSVAHLLPRGMQVVVAPLPYPRHDQRVSSGVLFVRNEEVQQRIEALNIPGVTKVINYKTYHATFNTPELVESLVNAHEVFMVDGVLKPLLELGGTVRRARDVLRVDCQDPEKSVARAFRCTTMPLEARKATASAVIGRSDATPQHLADNAMAVLDRLCQKQLPLGWRAIRSVRIKLDGTDAPALPIYHRADDVEATLHGDVAVLDEQAKQKEQEIREKEVAAAKEKESHKKQQRNDLRLVHTRWAAFRKNPHLFGEAPPPVEGEGESAPTDKQQQEQEHQEGSEKREREEATEVAESQPPKKKRKKVAKKGAAEA